jgi:hypothetical protein
VIWLAMGLAGAVLGVAFFGSLGLLVRLIVRHPGLAPLVAPATVARLLVLGGITAMLARAVPGSAVAVLAGILVGRWLCLRWVGERGLGR